MLLTTSAVSNSAATTTATDIISKITFFLWNNSGAHVYYLINFEDNLETLENKMKTLKGLRKDVKTKVKHHERKQYTRLAVVDDWLHRVEEIEPEVQRLLGEGHKEAEKRCIADCCPKNLWTCYTLGKKVSKKLMIVEELSSNSKFEIVAEKSIPSRVEVKPENETVGMDGMFVEVWSWLGNEKDKLIGICGMGGVGKTTLLKKINNAFLQKDDTQNKWANDYDVLIWVVVSSQFTIRNVQKQIGKRLGLEWAEDDDHTEKAELIFTALRKKKFMILFDDIWQPLNLEDIGIPSPQNLNNNSKIVFTTRSEVVCGQMEVNSIFKVPVLDPKNAWILFQQKLGREDLVLHRDIQIAAREIAVECQGLPLALITIGRAMATKKNIHEWNCAKRTLRQYASEFADMGELVLPHLRLSYDNLENETIRNCFLYFSLYPQDSNINKDEIVTYWIAEGFLDEFEDMDHAVEEGHDIIGKLKAACMLETGEWEDTLVKMHSVVRDLALWIAREQGNKKYKFLVQVFGVNQTPNIGNWKEAERISLLGNDMEKLTGTPKSPCLKTLMLRKNYFLAKLPNDFFYYMPCLKVLDLSETRLKDVPESIGSLVQLQYLNLSRTEVETLPDESGNLVKLRYLNLCTNRGITIPDGIIPCFTRLQVLFVGNWYDAFNNDLACLEHLRNLQVSINDVSQEDLRKMLLSQKLKACIRSLEIVRCRGATKLPLVSSLLLGKIKSLRLLGIKGWLDLEQLTVNCVNEDENMGLLSTLEILRLASLPKLNISWIQTDPDHHFKKLYDVEISYCSALKDISWLVLVPFLRILTVRNCKELEEIIPDGTAAQTSKPFSYVSQLQFISLPKLKSIITVALPFPLLKEVIISGCPLLKTLPFEANSCKALLRIEAEAEWWSNTEWEDDRVKTSLQPFFFPNSE